MSKFIKELRRRNIFKVGIAYLVVTWLLLQVTDVISSILVLPAWAPKLVLLLLLIGFIPALMLAWAFELTPDGIKPSGEAEPTTDSTPATAKNNAAIIIGMFVLVVLGAGGIWFMGQDARWATDEAMPQIGAYIDAGDWDAAYLLAREVEKVLSDDPILAELWSSFSWITTITSEPLGAMVFRRAYASTAADWEELGTTPLRDIHIPFGLSLIRLELDDHLPLLRVLGGGSHSEKYLPLEETPWAGFLNINPERYKFDTKESLPDGMVRVPGWTEASPNGAIEFGDFFIGRFEVTNKEFKKFVDDGGYSRPDLWEYEFFRDGQSMSWADAMAVFTDTTGRSGPAQWQASSYADGKDDYPVSGISWYEAAAFARYSRVELATIHHWRRAYAIGTLAWMLPASNVENDKLASVGQYQGIGWTGTFDMIGNVREWCLNAVGDERAIIGGSWNDAYYMAAETVAHPGRIDPFDRSITNGFRLAVTNDEPAATAYAQEAIAEPTIVRAREPVSDDVFAAYLRQFDYDHTPLNATIDATRSTRNWTREKISIDAGYAGDRLTLYLYMPLSEISRYQTIVYWPSADAFMLDSYDQANSPLEFALKNDRAVVVPIYEGTYDTSHSQPPLWGTNSGRDLIVQQVKDLRRTIDYLATRTDIDTSALAFYGSSWGGRIGALVLVVEPRLRVAILNQAGLLAGLGAEVDVINYLPRVEVPVLQFNGRFDTDFLYERDAKPFFDLLGTPPEDKKHVVEPTGHFAPAAVVIGETLAWLDKYLGPPKH